MDRKSKKRSEPTCVTTERLVFRNSPIHGTGGFARIPIQSGTRIIAYVGTKIDKAESVKRCEEENPYIFSLDDQHDLDGSVAWNPARFLNHSCAPNSEAVMDEDGIWIVALRDIETGEEVTFDYGYDLVDFREHPCGCGHSQCLGYIVAAEFADHVRRKTAPARHPSK